MQEKNTTNDVFISRLNVLMQDKALSQSRLCQLSGVSQTTISAYLLAKRSPGATELSRLAMALGVSMDWLWGVDNSTATQNEILAENIELNAKLKIAIGTLRGALDTLEK